MCLVELVQLGHIAHAQIYVLSCTFENEYVQALVENVVQYIGSLKSYRYVKEGLMINIASKFYCCNA